MPSLRRVGVLEVITAKAELRLTPSTGELLLHPVQPAIGSLPDRQRRELRYGRLTRRRRARRPDHPYPPCTIRGWGAVL